MNICSWLPMDWDRLPSGEERDRLETMDPDLLLVPEAHADISEREAWIQFADDTGTAVIAGFRDDSDHVAVFHVPGGRTTSYRRQADGTDVSGSPEDRLPTWTYREMDIVPTIGMDIYCGTFQAFQCRDGADLLVNIAATPVRRRKWGELLQARAIENGVYVLATMHGRDREGGKSRNNRAHAFAFDPYGEPLTLHDSEGTTHEMFDTRPEVLYSRDIDTTVPEQARTTLLRRGERGRIERVRDGRSRQAGTETTLQVTPQRDGLLLEHLGEEHFIGEGSVPFDELDLTVVRLEGEELLDPRAVASKAVQSYTGHVLFHNDWRRLGDAYLDNVVAPVARSRAVEWMSPIVMTGPDRFHGYELSSTARDTHRIDPVDGALHLAMERSPGPEKALERFDRQLVSQIAGRHHPES